MWRGVLLRLSGEGGWGRSLAGTLLIIWICPPRFCRISLTVENPLINSEKTESFLLDKQADNRELFGDKQAVNSM